ncbi:hypothetical protein D1825_09355 [Cellulomonas rhizosphaerae]|uniref:Uncharacterized protein n=1 Tax=Cellulomonas rhizosphaerae TaxID=2293719 RepID=A0A413RLL6_9CELL|nr:hypothetical protein D1825_09355 [Cellulomonas rhizosphaerae]
MKTGGAGSAACAEPATAASAQVVSPGEAVTITTRDLFDDCDDDGRSNTQMPRRDLTVTWVQGATTVDLGSGDANEAGVLTQVITVPPGAQEGTATIEVEGAVPAEVQVQS